MSMSSFDKSNLELSFSTCEKSPHPGLAILKKITLRKVLLKLHLYISLWLGAFLVIAGLTGSLLVYGTELDKWLNADMMTVAAGEKVRPLADLITIANQVSPIKSQPVHLQLPKQAEDALIVRYQVPMPAGKNHHGHNHHFYEVMINPYSGQVLGQRDRNDAFMTIILQLHFKLLAGEIGKLIMGITALMTLILTLSGLYLWWPKLNKLKQALVIKRNASFTRFNFDLHKTIGFYTAIILFVVSLSGSYFNFPFLFKPAVNFFSSVTEMPRDVKSTATGSAVRPESVLQQVTQRFPQAQIQRLSLPDNAKGSFMVSLRQANEIRHKGATMVWVDQYSGNILHVRDPNQFSGGDSFINLQLSLHNGEIFGTPGRILYIVAGFAPLLLMVTGIIHWLKKRHAKRQHSVRFASLS